MVLKDLDYVKLNELKSFFNMNNVDTQRIMRNIELDVSFLQSQKFMDYSLLMAVKRVGH